MNEPRVLYVRNEPSAAIPRAERRELEQTGQLPRRVLVEEAFGFDLLGVSDLAELPGIRGALLRRIPPFVALALEVVRRRRDYDVVVSWAEKYTLAIAGLLMLTRRRPRHVAIMDWISKPVVRVPLRVIRRGVDRILTWSSVQGAFAVEHLGFRPEQVQYIQHPVDHDYFAPSPDEHTTIFSAGETQRDFETLIAAAATLPLPTVIAASRIGVFTGFRTRLDDAGELELPTNVTVRAMQPDELRRGYAQAAVVVVPLMPAENNAGISVVLEAMSMGRPVVVTRTQGQVDVVRDGVSGLYVPAQDAAALRRAIVGLLDDPARAEQLGQAGRRTVLERHRLNDFAIAVRDAVFAMAGGEVSRGRIREI